MFVPENLPELFQRAVVEYPDRHFVRSVDNRRAWDATYGEAAIRIAGTIDFLEQLGLEPGDRVVCYLDDLVPSMYFMLSCVFSNVVFSPLAPSFSVRFLQDLVKRIGAKAIFTSPTLAPVILAEDSNLTVASFDTGDTQCERVHWIPWNSAFHDQRSAIRRLGNRPSQDGDSIYFIQPTSGTTGTPKLTARVHRAFLRTARLMSEEWETTAEKTPPERCLFVSQLTHGAGQQFLWTSIALAGELCVPREFGADCQLADIQQLCPTRFRMAPRVLRSLHRQYVDQGCTGKLLGPDARTVVVGGASCEPELLRLIRRHGVDVMENYGSTETGELIRTPPGQWREDYLGKALPDVELRLAHDGELLAQSPVVIDGYWGSSETGDMFTPDGFYRTGDFAEIDDDGWVRILGRKRDIFNTMDGSNLYPSRIEGLLEVLPWVHQAVLLGDGRAFLTALIVPRAEFRNKEDLHQLKNRARQDIKRMNTSLEPIEMVRRFRLVIDEFPDEIYKVVGLGKVNRNRKLIAKNLEALIDDLYRVPLDPKTYEV